MVLSGAGETGEELSEVLHMATKAEADLWEGPVCWIGHKGLDLLIAAKGLSFGVSTLEELEEKEQLPQPLTLALDTT
jgi:hypothetical protein